jgi:hypothetical protein
MTVYGLVRHKSRVQCQQRSLTHARRMTCCRRQRDDQPVTTLDQLASSLRTSIVSYRLTGRHFDIGAAAEKPYPAGAIAGP